MLLVGFGCENNKGSPWAIIIFHKAILLKLGYQIINHARLMWAIAWGLATNRFDFTGINMKNSTSDVFADTFFSKHIPVFLDKILNCRSVFTWTVSPLEVALDL